MENKELDISMETLCKILNQNKELFFVLDGENNPEISRINAFHFRNSQTLAIEIAIK